MSASKYLPPFTPDERSPVANGRPRTGPAARTDVTADGEVTYADFLGDEVDD